MIVEQREVRTTVKLHASELLRSDEKSRINYSVDNPPRARASPRIDPRDCTKAFEIYSRSRSRKLTASR